MANLIGESEHLCDYLLKNNIFVKLYEILF